MSDEKKIRIGTPADVHDIMELALMGSDENGIVTPDSSKMLEDIWSALNLDHGLMGIIGNSGEKPEGAILLKIGTMWYSGQEVLEEKAIMIHPDYRAAKGGRARRLCEFSKQVADELDLPLIIGVLSTIRTEGKVRMYQRVFGPPAGAFFLYNAHSGGFKEAVKE